MRLVVTEKPSVARDLGRVLGVTQRRDGYLEGSGMRITWCIGHLLELCDPAHYETAWKRWDLDTLPMVPERFELQVRKGSEDQWNVVRRLLRDVDVHEVVNACDAGREGELIFRYAYQQAACSKPVLRLWVSSLTDQAIQGAWSRLRPSAGYDALADAARCRSEADWLVGLNATRAMTVVTRNAGGDALWSVGRVQTPTLAMIAARDREIEAFVAETYWQVRATLAAEPGTWKATWYRVGSSDDLRRKDGSKETPTGQRLGSEADAQAVVDAATGRAGVVSRVDRRQKREPPPLLYDLTALQRRANQRYGMSASRTLELAQELYEKHKLITYPRTDARHITTDQVPELPGILQGVRGLRVYQPFCDVILGGAVNPGRRVVDDAEVGDHHAILPTNKTPSSSSLSTDCKRIYDLVARRFLAVLSEDALIDLSEIVTEIHPDPSVELPDDVPVPLTFKAKGRVLRQAGWREVDPPRQTKDVLLPAVDQGDAARVAEAAHKEAQTRPPRPHDDASLLDFMEKAGRNLDDASLKRALKGSGLGTPATRASILQTLVQRGYVLRKGKQLLATEKGHALIDTLPSGELKSAELTGRWEKRLTDMAEGKESRQRFMADVVQRLQGIIGAITEVVVPEAARRRERPEGKEIGTCPACGKPVRERGKVFGCDTGRSCPFVVFGTMSTRKISARMVKELLTSGRTKIYKGFKSKKGKPFEAGLVVEEGGKVGFYFPEREDWAPAAPRRPSKPDGLACPGCGQGKVIRGRAAWGCSRWREGCGWRLSFEQDGERLTDAQAVERMG